MLLSCWNLSLHAQDIPFSSSTFSGQGLESREQGEIPEGPDSVGIFKYHALNPDQEYHFLDSTLHQRVQQYDPARQRAIDYATLGTLGSAARPIWFSLPYRQGFSVGLNQFKLYHLPFDSLPYHRVGRAYTDLGYAQGAQQADGYIKARLGKNFGENLVLNADYDRISQLGTQNQFPNQNSRVTALGTGIYFRSRSKRYRGFIGFVTNIVEQENNGGLQVEPENAGDFSTPQSADVFLSNSVTRNVRRTLGYTHHFSLTSAEQKKRSVLLTHQVTYTNSNFKTTHEFPGGILTDTAFYNRFPDFLVDARGGRFQMRHNFLQNGVYLSFAGLDPGGPFQTKRQKGLIRVGIRHTLHLLRQAPVDSTINNLFLEGEASFNPSPKLKVRAFGHLGLLDNGGDYRVGGDFDFSIGRFVGLFATVENQLYSPVWLQDRFILTGSNVWRNDFSKTLATSLKGGLRFPRLGLQAEVGYHLLNNYIYYDSLALPRQIGSSISVFQLALHLDLKVGDFYLDNSWVGQRSTAEEAVRLPEIFGKHSLYYRGRWFRVLNVKIGFDGRYFTRFFPDYYMPISGQFVIQNGRPANFYPSVDGFFAFRVTKFKAIVKWENMERIFSAFQNRFFYLSGYYPIPTGPGFRIGISWRFEN